MGKLIPHGWDGEGWDCWQIEWPASAEYRQLLYDVLYGLTRGRYWDEKSGRITDAQEIAWAIFGRNVPFRGCGGVVGNGGGGGGSGGSEPSASGVLFGYDCAFGGGDVECTGECIVSSCPVPGIRIYEGRLEVWHCCDWVPVPGDGSVLRVDPADVPSEPEEEEPDNQPCVNAHAVVSAIEEVVDTVQTTWSTTPVLNAVYTSFRAVAPYSDRGFLPTVQYLAALVAAAFIDATPVDLDLTTYERQSLLCGLAQVLGSDAVVGDAEHAAALGVIDATLSPTKAEVFRRSFEYFQPDGLTRAIAIYQPVGGEDCACPLDPADAETEPTESGWYLSRAYDFEVSGGGLDAGEYNAWCRKFEGITRDVYGVVIESHTRTTWDSTTFNQIDSDDASLVGVGPDDIPAPGAAFINGDSGDFGVGDRLVVCADSVAAELYGGAYRSGGEYLGAYPGNNGGNPASPPYPAPGTIYVGGRFGPVTSGGSARFRVRLIYHA